MNNNNLGMEWAGTKKQSDPWLVSIIFLILGIGLVTLYSASYAYAQRLFNDSSYFIRRQLLFVIPGFVLFMITSRINLEVIRRYIMPLVLGTLFLCILPLIPGIGITKNGANRWINLGYFSFQPSELAKIIMPLYLAHMFDKKRDRLYELKGTTIPLTIMVLLFFVVIYLQNNFSTASFLFINAMVLFFLAGVRFRYFIGLAVMSAPFLALMILSKEHRLSRLINFMQPEWDPLGAGYQVRASVLTIMSGGFWGKGIGQGQRKIASVPEIQSDFIFSSFAEEVGFVGVSLFFIIIIFFMIRSFRIASQGNTIFVRLLLFGITTMLVSQMILNVAVVAGVVPATGVPLPFFSAGGSSLAMMLAATGFLVNGSRRIEQMEDVHV
ncbi:putative lipid II flippase FtsW [Gracilinema caldarium]|uniref:Probable peptidoglycan glycosyltransferase FtsW n=1 Tax=Gracilinema caldarium (strain ATCC 51460 / DSM 7334 / H1) TaxID=744872 RepID=F8F1Y0_GRAC1|nr:putative lipid II flippase FtsW [Gracilinema caldarium]AEJ19827.1 cell division protein FtsW [Gracilinema caldarium DSM 7334]